MIQLSIDVGTAIGYLDLDITGFKSGFSTAMEDLRTFEDSSATASTKFKAVGSSLSSVGSSLTTGLTLPLVGIGTAAVNVGNTFEAAMSRVKSIAGATEEEFQSLKDQAIDLGAKTSFSATEAANGMENLASAGFTVSEIMEAMPGLLDLAASSGTDLGTASEIAASAVRGFGLEAKDTIHVADAFAEAAARTNAQTEDMGEAMKYIAPVAHAMGQSLEMTAAAVGIMSDAGIKGSQAGTSLRGALSRLAKPTDVMYTKMEALGLSFYDSSGNMLSLVDIVAQLEDKMSGLTQEQRNNALVTLFGQESLSGMLALIQRGPEELQALTEQLENADGAAANMADTMLDNTAGSVEEFTGSVETLAIKLQQALAPMIRSILEKLTEFVNWMSSLDDETIELITKIGLFVAALGPVLLVFGKISSAIGGIIQAFSSIKTAFSGFSTALSGLGASSGVLMGIAAIIGVIIAAIKHLWDTSKEFRDNIINTWNRIQKTFSEFAKGIVDRLNALGFEFEDITDVLYTIWDGFCNLLAPVFEAAFQVIADVLGGALDVLTGIFDVFAGIFTGNWEQAWTGIQEIFGGIWDAIVGILTGAFDAIKGVTDEILGWFGTSWDQIGQQLGINLENIQGQVSSWWDAFLEYNEQAWQDIPGTMQKNFEVAKQVISDFGESIVQKAKEYGKWYADTTVDFFKQLPDRIKEFLDQALNAIKDWAVNSVVQAVNTGKAFVENIKNFFVTLPDTLKVFLDQALNAVKDWVVNYVVQSAKAGQEFISNVKYFFSNLPTIVSTWFNETIEKVKAWGTDMVTRGYEAINSFKSTVITTIQDLPNKIYEIGNNIVTGLWNGINDMKDWLFERIGTFFDDIVNGIKDGLGIHSPSTVMAEEIGHWMPLGVASGFEAMVPQLISRMQDSLNKGIKNLNPESIEDQLLNGMLSFSNGVQIIYVDLYSWIQSISSQMVSSMDTTIQKLTELMRLKNSLVSIGLNGTDLKTKSAKSSPSAGISSVSSANSNVFVFNSPEAIDHVKAAKLLKQTAQQIALGTS